jgi:hypothetical protein
MMSAGMADELGEVERTEDGKDQSAPLPNHLMHLTERERVQKLTLERLFAEQEHGLRQSYADWILRILGAQFLIADVVFVAFAWAGRRWDLPSGVIEVWLAATVVQILGVVAVVTRHLFPNRDGRAAAP